MPQLEVKLSKLLGQSQSPTGWEWTEVTGVWRVDVFDDNLQSGREDDKGNDLGYGKLHIGMIGRQDGANFCQNHEFGKFTPEQRDSMIAQIRALHGHASPEPPMELPEPIEPEYDEDDEFDEEDFDTEESDE